MSVMVIELYDALRGAGVDDDKAKAAAHAVLAELVTKADLKAELSELETRLIRWHVGTLIAVTAIYGGLVAALKIFG